jgi:hypothetical protein
LECDDIMGKGFWGRWGDIRLRKVWEFRQVI